jgi:hypothetical protein
MSVDLYYWPTPRPEEIAVTAVEFLHALPGPTHIYLPGRDSSRCRVVITLLHGNEPSGLSAVHALLRQGVEPAVDLHFFIPSVEAARATPLFNHRMLPGERDLNRCFKPPFSDNPQSQLAKTILDELQRLRPEAIIDVHNTSGVGPSFGVITFMDARHESLVSLFAHRLVVTDLQLGSVMELSERLCPTVTIECGGARDAESDRIALIGMTRFLSLDNVLELEPGDIAMEFFRHPVRLELRTGASIGYGNTALPVTGINLLPDVEQLNFNDVPANTPLGFITGELEAVLSAVSTKGEDCLPHYFQIKSGKLITKQCMRFFMVTNNPEIARSDCLLYFVPA